MVLQSCLGRELSQVAIEQLGTEYGCLFLDVGVGGLQDYLEYLCIAVEVRRVLLERVVHRQEHLLGALEVSHS